MEPIICGVCFEEVLVAISCHDSENEEGIPHNFCENCVKNYAEVAIYGQPLSEKARGLPCMELDCDRVIEYDSFSGLIEEHAIIHFLERYEREIAQKAEKDEERGEDGEMMEEIKSLQNRVSTSLTLECQSCGVQYLKVDGCHVVKCRCGKKQCGICGKLFSSKYDSVHQNENYISLHLVSCQNSSLEKINDEINQVAQKYDIEKKKIYEYFPHMKDRESNRYLKMVIYTVLISLLVCMIVLPIFELYVVDDEHRWEMTYRVIRLILDIVLEYFLH